MINMNKDQVKKSKEFRKSNNYAEALKLLAPTPMTSHKNIPKKITCKKQKSSSWASIL